jgi:Chaperone of endosialidase
MAFESILDLLTLRRDGVEDSQWPRLSCSQAQQATLGGSDLRLEAGRELFFQDQGQIRSFDDTHKLVFNRGGNLLELHEQGDIRFLTGGPPPTERLRLRANGQVGLGTATPTQALEVVGTVKATAFEGDGAGLTGVSASDATRVAKAGDTMSGPLAITAAEVGLRVSNHAAVGGMLTVAGQVGIGTLTPGTALHVWQSRFGNFPIAIEPGGWGVIGFNSYWNGSGRVYAVNGFAGCIALSADDGSFSFYTAPSGVQGNKTGEMDRMVITNSGQVGIGTTNPGAPLHVAQYMAVGPFAATAGQGGIDVTGPVAELGFVRRSLISWPAVPAAGDRFVWYNPEGTARLWTEQRGDLLTVTSLGNVGIGTTVPATKLHVTGARIRLEKAGTIQRLDLRADGSALDIESAGADLYLNNNNLAVRIRNLIQGSSREWKEDVAALSSEDATQLLDHLNPTTFRFKEDASRQRHLGFVAEEVPDSVATPDKKGFSPVAIIAVLTKVVKEQQEQIAAFREEMALLKHRVK